jgi:L-seryl-tRNA(Ser) seleniumtransferase
MGFIGTRRKFFGWTNSVLIAGGAARNSEQAANARPAAEGEDYYDKLGVTKIINAAGSYTALSASTMPRLYKQQWRARRSIRFG